MCLSLGYRLFKGETSFYGLLGMSIRRFIPNILMLPVQFYHQNLKLIGICLPSSV